MYLYVYYPGSPGILCSESFATSPDLQDISALKVKLTASSLLLSPVGLLDQPMYVDNLIAKK